MYFVLIFILNVCPLLTFCIVEHLNKRIGMLNYRKSVRDPKTVEPHGSSAQLSFILPYAMKVSREKKKKEWMDPSLHSTPMSICEAFPPRPIICQIM